MLHLRFYRPEINVKICDSTVANFAVTANQKDKQSFANWKVGNLIPATFSKDTPLYKWDLGWDIKPLIDLSLLTGVVYAKETVLCLYQTVNDFTDQRRAVLICVSMGKCGFQYKISLVVQQN